ncbi:PLDc N-terminal domain-containing protein [Arthrobacter pigmenti]
MERIIGSVAGTAVNPTLTELYGWVTPLFGVIYVILAVGAIASVLRSQSVPGLAKGLWLIAVIIAPLVGAVAWFIFMIAHRPGGGSGTSVPMNHH